MKSVEQLRLESAKAGIYEIEESQGKWLCVQKSSAGFLARNEHSEAMALRAGLARVKLMQPQIDM